MREKNDTREKNGSKGIMPLLGLNWDSLVAQTVKHLQETQVRSLDQEDPLEKEMANPLQYSCLENPMDGGVWQATVHGVTKSWT